MEIFNYSWVNNLGMSLMLGLLGIAAIAIGAIAFDFSTAFSGDENGDLETEDNKEANVDADLTDENDSDSESDSGPLGSDQVVGSEASELGLTEPNQSEAFDQPDPIENEEVNTGGLPDSSAFFNDFSSSGETTTINSNGSDGQQIFLEKKGTENSDSLLGVNVHIDVATGIVGLFGNSSEHLFGGGGDDLLAVGFGDFAEGGDGSDEFIVDGVQTSDESGVEGVPIIGDFVLGQDQIEISVPTSEDDLEATYPDRPLKDFEVSFEHADNETLIMVDGVVACKLVGLFDLTENDVQVKYDYHSDLKTDFDDLYGY